MVETGKRLTLEEFLALPEEEPALEYEEGVVTQKPMPKAVHARLQLALGKLFDQAGEAKKLFLALTELRFTLPNRSHVPDVAVYLWDRVPVDDTGRVVDIAPQPPDVAIEIVSPDQSVTALIRKCLWYVENGVKAALLVDPMDSTVLLFRGGQPYRALQGSDVIELSDILPEFQATPAQIFGALKVR